MYGLADGECAMTQKVLLSNPVLSQLENLAGSHDIILSHCYFAVAGSDRLLIVYQPFYHNKNGQVWMVKKCEQF